MVAERKWIELDDDMTLRDALDQAKEEPEGVVIREGGRLLGRVTAFDDQRRKPSILKGSGDRDAFLSAAGGWEGDIDVEAFIRDNRESRERSSRPYPSA